jgi:hypothetical protein
MRHENLPDPISALPAGNSEPVAAARSRSLQVAVAAPPGPQLYPDEDDVEAAPRRLRNLGPPGRGDDAPDEAIPFLGHGYFRVSAPDLLVPGQYYLIGAPGQSSCEVVQIADCGWVPGEPVTIRRGQLKSVGGPQPVGTPVRAVTARFVADWGQEELEGSGEGAARPEGPTDPKRPIS